MTILLVVEDGIICNMSPSSFKKTTSFAPIESDTNPSHHNSANPAGTHITPTQEPEQTDTKRRTSRDVKSLLSAEQLLNRSFDEVFVRFAVDSSVNDGRNSHVLEPDIPEKHEGSEKISSMQDPLRYGTPVHFRISPSFVDMPNLRLFGKMCQLSPKTIIYFLIPMVINPDTFDTDFVAQDAKSPLHISLDPSITSGLYPAFIFNDYGMILHSLHDAIPSSVSIMSLIDDSDLINLCRRLNQRRSFQTCVQLVRPRSLCTTEDNSILEKVQLNVSPIDTINDSGSPLWLAEFHFHPGNTSANDPTTETIPPFRYLDSGEPLLAMNLASDVVPPKANLPKDESLHSHFEPTPTPISNRLDAYRGFEEQPEIIGPKMPRSRHNNILPSESEAGFPNEVAVVSRSRQKHPTRYIIDSLKWMVYPFVFFMEKGLQATAFSMSTSFHYTMSFGKFYVKTFVIPFTPSPIYHGSKYLLVQVQSAVLKGDLLRQNSINQCVSFGRAILGDAVVDSVYSFLKRFM